MRGVSRPPLATSVLIAIVLLWINVGLGVIVLFTTSSSAPVTLAWMAGFAAVAIGLQRRAVLARNAGVALSGIAYIVGLTHGMFISTTLAAFVALLWPSAVRAARVWAGLSHPTTGTLSGAEAKAPPP